MVKTVSIKQMNNLLNLGRTPGHPYSYRFGYSLKNRSITVQRFRRISSVMPGRNVSAGCLANSTGTYMQSALRRIEKAEALYV